MANGTASMEARMADLEAKLAGLTREIQVLADGVTRAIDAAMHVKLELEEVRVARTRAKRPAAAGEAA